jgi:hypothetical protein
MSTYDTDFYAWTQQQAQALAAGDLDGMDLVNLAEEIESLGKRDWRELSSRLEILVMHLLKWQYQPEMRESGNSWRRTIRTQRRDIGKLLEQSPSLRRQVAPLIEADYPGVREDASDETRLPLSTFPEACPWTEAQVLDMDFWPERRSGAELV